MESTADVPPVREVVAHAWFTMGFPPSRSLVLVEMRPLEGGESPGFVARVDLPPPRHTHLATGALAAIARRQGVGAAVLLVVLDPSPHPGHDRPAGSVPIRPMPRLVRDLRTRLRRAGVTALDVVVIDRGRYRSLLCDDTTCCPPEGLELGDLSTTRTAAAMVMSGRSLVADETGLVADVTARPWPPEVLAAVAPDTPPAPELLERWQRAVEGRLAAGAACADPEPEAVAWLVPALDDLRFRDAVLVSLLPGGQSLARRLASGQVTGVPELGATETRRPDDARFDAGRALLAAVARGAPAGARGEALAVLAWMSWWRNDAVRARILTAMAARDRPGHRLAGLVDTLLLHGVPPRWLVASGAVRRPVAERRAAGC